MRLVFALAILLAPAAQAQPSQFGTKQARPVVEACLGARGADDCIGAAFNACERADPAQNQTTAGMAECANLLREVWDDALNREYAALMDRFARDDAVEADYRPEGALLRVDTMRTAQRAWIAFRDADCSNAYARWGNGSMRLIAGSLCRMRMTADRTIELAERGEMN